MRPERRGRSREREEEDLLARRRSTVRTEQQGRGVIIIPIPSFVSLKRWFTRTFAAATRKCCRQPWVPPLPHQARTRLRHSHLPRETRYRMLRSLILTSQSKLLLVVWISTIRHWHARSCLRVRGEERVTYRGGVVVFGMDAEWSVWATGVRPVAVVQLSTLEGYTVVFHIKPNERRAGVFPKALKELLENGNVLLVSEREYPWFCLVGGRHWCVGKYPVALF